VPLLEPELDTLPLDEPDDTLTPDELLPPAPVVPELVAPLPLEPCAASVADASRVALGSDPDGVSSAA
jgi:hypothetical protein